ncbi:MAG: TIGR02281 family clan AA aspartic protease [Paracoccaceae bacterium]
MSLPAHLPMMLDASDTPRLIYMLLLLAAVSGWAMVEYRKRMGQALRTALAWGMIFVGLMAGYGLWADIRKDILPQQMVESGHVTIPLGRDGHYHPTLNIDGQTISFVADTGASTVVLSPADARRLGIDPDTLVFVGQAMTANGMVRTASITLPNVTFGPFHDETVQAEVNEADMDGSLLGMSYLGRFSITMGSNQMILSR